MLVTVIIPTYNRSNGLVRVLEALRGQSMQDFSVLIVDNSSEDDTVEMVARERLTWGERLNIEVKEPNGPASARNRGVELASSEFIIFLDSDVELAPNWIECACEHLRAAPHIAAVGGKILYAFERQRLNAYGGDLGHFGLAWDVLEGAAESEAQLPQPRIWINCSAMLCRREACLEVGGFDERFFYGFEDSDIGWKLNLLGHGVWVYPDLSAYHHVEPEAGDTNPLIVFHFCKNRLRSLLKNSSSVTLWLRLLGYGAYTLVDGLLRAPRLAKLRAVKWNISHLNETLAMRRQLQSQRQVGDGEIFRLGSGRLFPPTRLGGQRRRAAPVPESYRSERDSQSLGDDRV